MIHRVGICAVVCLLNAPGDKPIFESVGFDFRCYPVDNGKPPNLGQADNFSGFMESCRSGQLPVAVYCQGGMGRTGTVIARYWIRTGRGAREAIWGVRAKESSAVETQAQILFLEEFEKRHRNKKPSSAV